MIDCICHLALLPATLLAPDGLTAELESTPARQVVTGKTVRETLLSYAREPSHGFQETAGLGNRLLVFCDTRPGDSDDAFYLSEAILQRFEDAFGVQELSADDGQIGFIIGDEDRFQRLCDVAAAADPVNASFLRQSRESPGFLLYESQVAAIRRRPQDSQLDAEHALAHSLVHLESFRRFGLLPLWLVEGLAYAGEEGADGMVRSNYFRTTPLSAAEMLSWRGLPTQDLVLDEKLDLSQLYAYTARPFQTSKARLAFAFAVYGLEADPKGLQRFCEGLARIRTRTWKGGDTFLPPAREIEAVALDAFGPDFLTSFQGWWELQRPPEVFAARIREAVDEFSKNGSRSLKERATEDGRLRMLSDLTSSRSRKVTAMAEAVFERLDHAFGPLWNPQKDAYLVLAVEDPEIFEGLCKALAQADPRNADFLLQSAQDPCFALPDTRVLGFLESDESEDVPLEHRVAHKIVHLECIRRFGELPSWLGEGLACALEEAADGYVWANCHRPEPESSAARRRWRGRVTKGLLKSSDLDLAELYAWSASDYDDEIARIGYAFATYGLEVDPPSLKKLCYALADAARRARPAGDAHALSADDTASIVEHSFGMPIAGHVQAYWKDPPSADRAWRKQTGN